MPVRIQVLYVNNFEIRCNSDDKKPDGKKPDGNKSRGKRCEIPFPRQFSSLLYILAEEYAFDEYFDADADEDDAAEDVGFAGELGTDGSADEDAGGADGVGDDGDDE